MGSSIVVCCGAGGVGKTTVAAALGVSAARAGSRAVVVTIDPARRLADALGMPGGLTGEPRQVDIEAAGELWAMMLDTPAMFERVVRRHAASTEQAARIVDNRFYRNIARALSGTQEYMASEALFELHDDPRFDMVIVDTPPSRNALDFLEAPGVLARFLGHPVFQLMMLPTRGGLKFLSIASQPILRAIGRVVGSDVLADAAAFFQAFAGMEAGFRQRAQAVGALLASDATEFVLVATARPDTLAEARWFAEQLGERKLRIGAIVANRLHPRFGDGSAADATRRAARASSAGRHDEAALWSNLAELRRVADAERALLTTLARCAPEAMSIEVPMLAEDVHDVASLDHVATHLVALLA